MKESQDIDYNGIESPQDLSELSNEELLREKKEALENEDGETVLKIVQEIARREVNFVQEKARREIEYALKLKDGVSKLKKEKELWMSHGAKVYAGVSRDIIINMDHMELKDELERISNMELDEGVTLNLSSNEIGDVGAKWISKIKLNKGCYLNLYLNKIGAEGAKAIAENLKLEEGVRLCLMYNKIGAEGAKAISKMELKENVRLDLTGNKIGDEGAKAISKMELKENVRLDLTGNEIGDEGADTIMENLDMKDGVELILEQNCISKGKKKELKSWAKSYKEKGIKCKVSC